jgi:hypothetical protein
LLERQTPPAASEPRMYRLFKSSNHDKSNHATNRPTAFEMQKLGLEPGKHPAFRLVNPLATFRPATNSAATSWGATSERGNNLSETRSGGRWPLRYPIPSTPDAATVIEGKLLC